MSRTPSRRRSLSSPADTRLPSPAAFPAGARQGPGSLGWLWRLELQHPALWGSARAGARCALAVGNPRCSTIALPPRAPFTYANTLKPAFTPQARQHIRQQRGQGVLHRLVQHRPLRLPPPVRPPALLHPLLPFHTFPGHTLLSASHGPLVSPGRPGNSGRLPPSRLPLLGRMCPQCAPPAGMRTGRDGMERQNDPA